MTRVEIFYLKAAYLKESATAKEKQCIEEDMYTIYNLYSIHLKNNQSLLETV